MGIWVFGYGSLIWNPGFSYKERVVGYIKDYQRAFDLACFHRGTTELPARMCNLQHKPGAICWGVAYLIEEDTQEEKQIIQYLEKRECEYDSKAYVNFYCLESGRQKKTLTFISSCKESNKYYIGSTSLEKTASQIAMASGPCGTNREYLFKLEKALDELGFPDFSIIELANEVREGDRRPDQGIWWKFSAHNETIWVINDYL